jgi:hypothetical protein
VLEGKLACTSFLLRYNVVSSNGLVVILEGKLVGARRKLGFIHITMYFVEIHLCLCQKN